MDWPLVFLRSFVVVSLGGCPTIGRADLALTKGASESLFQTQTGEKKSSDFTTYYFAHGIRN